MERQAEEIAMARLDHPTERCTPFQGILARAANDDEEAVHLLEAVWVALVRNTDDQFVC